MDTPRDPHLWLEEVLGEDALAWVRERNLELSLAERLVPAACLLRATALAAFNVGIDVAQTTVVLMIVAALGLCSMALADRSSADRLAIDQPNSDRMAWVRVPTAAIAAVIGLTWTATRISSVVL